MVNFNSRTMMIVTPFADSHTAQIPSFLIIAARNGDGNCALISPKTETNKGDEMKESHEIAILNAVVVMLLIGLIVAIVRLVALCNDTAELHDQNANLEYQRQFLSGGQNV